MSASAVVDAGAPDIPGRGGAGWLSRHPLLRCLAIYRQIPVRFGICLALFIGVNLGLAAWQHLVGRAVNDLQNGRAVVRLADGSLDLRPALAWVAILVGVAAGRAVLQYGAALLSLTIGQDLLSRLRVAILVQVQRLDLAYHLRHGIGEMVTRTTRDADKVRDALISVWRNVVETSLVLIGAHRPHRLVRARAGASVRSWPPPSASGGSCARSTSWCCSIATSAPRSTP